MRTVAVILAIAGVTVPALAAPSDWIVRRSVTSGTCFIVPITSSPNLGPVIATKPDAAEACKAAAALKTDDAGDRAHCFDYTLTGISFCHAKGVDLPK